MDLIRLGRLACAQRKIEVLYQRKRRYMVYFVQMNYLALKEGKDVFILYILQIPLFLSAYKQKKCTQQSFETN